jgi:glyceraldehyde 3-phosphate dehydrogenase
VFAETNPAALPWGDVGAEVVIESSGHFRDPGGGTKHLEAGARKAIISAPAKEPDVPVRPPYDVQPGVGQARGEHAGVA